MKLLFIRLLISFSYSQEIELTEIPVDQHIIEERNTALQEFSIHLRELSELQELIQTQLNHDQSNLKQTEDTSNKNQARLQESIPILLESSTLKASTMVHKLFMTLGLPVGAGTAVGTAGFFATKATLIAAAPFLAATSVPVIVPATFAVAAGGATLVVSKMILGKLV